MFETDPLIERLREAVARYETLGLKMAEPDVIADFDRLRKLAQEHSQLEPLATAATRHFKLLGELDQARELVASGEDPELGRDYADHRRGRRRQGHRLGPRRALRPRRRCNRAPP